MGRIIGLIKSKGKPAEDKQKEQSKGKPADKEKSE